MKFHTAPRNQGQMVEYAYAAANGMVYRRITDRSNGSIRYAVSRMMRDDAGEYWQAIPKNKRWRILSAVDMQRALSR